ncbi:hypothetical protein CSC81_10250 [Tenacibaculum discolor]|uniref:Recombinase family protein n=1 Tax=Tenacibaculum discolor TaxID=361581 RepID=A0A2G1BTS6_9FLAO|nr:recombinase family protein [Tenacibaculum discolor]MDP2541539.1 recombinase family protein [Tenacibaculum discolor]PHN97447.1 hypothetical protein CSC81_10250 [Tenacibaculum discolor]
MLGIYARISREEDNESKSVENQVKAGKLFADSQKLNFKVYSDINISGTLDIKNRPEFLSLINDIKLGHITHVFSTNQDRLERNPLVWFEFSNLLLKHNVKLFFDKGVQFDLENDDSQFYSKLTSLINERYVATTTKKIKSVIERNVSEGKVHASPSYGFKKGENGLLIIDESESQVIKRIFDLSMKGIGTTTIAKILNDENIPTKYSKNGKGTYSYTNSFGEKFIYNKKDAKWKATTIRAIIKNRLYKGERKWNDKIYNIESIIDPIYWRKVNDNLPNNANHRGKKVNHQYLLKGILKCSICGRSMNGKRRIDKSDNFYYCASKRIKSGGCGNRSINIDKLEEFIWSTFFVDKKILNTIKNNLEDVENECDKIKLEIEQSKRKINDYNSQKDKILEFIALNDIDLNDDNLSKKFKKLDSDINEEKILLNDLSVQLGNYFDKEKLLSEYNFDFKKHLKKLSFLEKKELIKKYINRIEILNLKDKISIHTYQIKLYLNLQINKPDTYFFDTKHNVIFSHKDLGFINSPILHQSSSYEILKYSDFDFKSIKKNGKFYVQPYKYEKNTYSLLNNTIIPHGNFSDWNFKKILKFYSENKDFFSEEIGVSILSIMEDKEKNKSLSETYKKHRERYNSNFEKWIKDLCEVQKIPLE